MELTFRELTLLNCAAIEKLLEQNGNITIIAGHGRKKHPVFIVNKLQHSEVEVKQEPEGELITDTILDTQAFNGKITEEELRKWAQTP